MKHRRLLYALAVILPLAAACDDDEEVIFEVYRASLVQVNPQMTLSIPTATAEIIVEDDEVVQVRVEGLGLDAVGHPTFLRSGAGCPTDVLDTNDDGVVDVIEGEAAYGTILLPFDADISNQGIELGTFPTGASFSYFESSDFEDVVDAIAGPDVDPDDFVFPLPAGEVLDLERRTIVVHGVAPALLPTPHSARSLDGLDAPATIPILCGRLSRVE